MKNKSSYFIYNVIRIYLKLPLFPIQQESENRNFTLLFPVQWEIFQKCQFSSFSHFKRKQNAFFEKIAVPFQKETGVFRFFGFSYQKRNKRPFENTFPIFRTCCGTIYFFCRKEKNHSQSGFSDCPWSFPICYDMCIFALCFRYNGN